MNTLQKLKDLADFKYKIGSYIGTELTKLNSNDSEEIKLKKSDLISEGIGSAIGIKTCLGENTLAVLEDYDFETDPSNRRYIFKYYDKHSDSILMVDTLYDTSYIVINDGGLK